ncbi:MAG TPA: tRNA (adenosine(37)-N6)-threonylcarbamoyltransferase complex ATPase subunit type 1 TsaE [Negativicutes bacterium]|nr:tRNA (adenosine(37)-N6)-threonylcarbamoyltransferase complex ATPase subunit type 1 TsaE [Negativicutes bacterium]
MDKFTTNSPGETQKIAADVAERVLAAAPKKSATVLGLEGDLGAGKTTFLQGFARGLGIKEVVNSPTFIIMKKFQITNSKSQTNPNNQNPKFKTFYHFDLYRLEDEKEFEFFNFTEIISNPKNIVAIEWPEKITRILPEAIISIQFIHKSSTQRALNIGGLSV